MDFEWDQAKSDANLEERGFDFDFASLYTNRLIGNRLVRRIISALRSNQREREAYEAHEEAG